jgi:hypothetical protein
MSPLNQYAVLPNIRLPIRVQHHVLSQTVPRAQGCGFAWEFIYVGIRSEYAPFGHSGTHKLSKALATLADID